MSPKAFILSMVLLLVLGVAFFVGLHFYLNQSSTAPKSALLGPVTQEPVSLILTLSGPDDNQLTFDSHLLLQGRTSSDAAVILSSDGEDLVLDTDNKGNFSTTIKLRQGLNQMTVRAFDSSGNSKSENRTIYYSTEKI